ncbi:integrase [Vibrio sp. JC009]|uniref:integrase n=1 Tax=Vibrio sp. JC009 TaxID=2912314 RepID=UPI0023AE8F90|nr:integrase [Vibrio sp. JC009]WED21573.1 integrase [Vibrio sp. JC009]
MNSNVVYFSPKQTQTAKENLDAFIKFCKEKLTAFGSYGEVDGESGIPLWDMNRWETVRGDKPVRARFSKLGERSPSASYESLSSPFIDFAKAYIKYSYTEQPFLQPHFRLLALRVLEQVLLNIYGEADLLKLDGRGLAHIPTVVTGEGMSPMVANKMGYQLEKILTFCRKNLFIPNLPSWANIYPKQKDFTIFLTDEFKEIQSEKLPTDDEMYLLADFFREAPNLDIEAEYYSSLFVFLMVAPSRAGELLDLTLNPFVWETNKAGEEKLGIRWYPAKGGDSGVKWVPDCMKDAVLEAYERLVRIGHPAREMAQFAIDHPYVLPLTGGLRSDELLNPDMPMTVEQFKGVMGFNNEGLTSFPANKWINKIREDNNGNVTFRALGETLYQQSIHSFKKFPVLSNRQPQANVTESLLLHRENEFHKTASPTLFSFRLPTVTEINNRLSGSSGKGYKSIFERTDFRLKDGSFPYLTTHQPRHWLNTKAQSGGMDELVLARWSGRAKLTDNRSYDHRTQEEKAREVALLMNDDEITIPIKIKANLPVTFKDIGKDLDGAAIVTELGICEHDYAMAPCGRHGDCETCKEMVCIKGFSSSLDQLKKREKEVETQFEKASRDHERGIFGADRWVSGHAWRLAHIKTKITLLEDERIPDGTPIRIPEQYDPSPVKEALSDKGFDVGGVEVEAEKVANDVFKLLEL